MGAYLNNDLALLRVKTGRGGAGIQLGRNVLPACLPQPSTPYKPGTECTISGWGSIGGGTGGYSRHMQVK